MSASVPSALRVMHVVDSLEVGGLERVVCDLARAQREAGFGVHVFSLNRTDGLRAELESAGVPVISGDKSGGFDRTTIARMRDCVHDARIDVVHAHSFVPNYYSAVALMRLGARRPPLLGTCHDMGQRLSNRRLRWLYRLSLLRTARVAMVGRQVHQRLTRTGVVPAGKAVLVRNGIPITRFAEGGADRGSARRTLGLDDDALVIGAVGRLVGLKNHALLIRALPALRRDFPSLTLALIGDGPLAPDLKALSEAQGVADAVRFCGQRQDVAALLPALDVFAMPSLTEGLSIALLEACASGLPIVTTNVGGNPETIEDGTTGMLVPPADDQAFARALRRLLADDTLRVRLGQSARDWAMTNASVTATAAVYERIYRGMLDA